MRNKDKKSIAMVSDFDGTISKIDFFYYVIDNLLAEGDVAPWLDYTSGKITHVEALRRIFAKIRVSDREFNDFVLNLPIEESFVETVNYCNENSMDFYIISAGADYYINLILEKLKIKPFVKLISNPSIYSQQNGLQLLKSDVNSPYYSLNYGVSKKIAVENIRKNNDLVVFAGDGVPDFDAAKIADVVFARGALLDLCLKNKIKAEKLDSYDQILKYLCKAKIPN